MINTRRMNKGCNAVDRRTRNPLACNMDKEVSFEEVITTREHLQGFLILLVVFRYWHTRGCQMVSQQTGPIAAHLEPIHGCSRVDLVEYLYIIGAAWNISGIIWYHSFTWMCTVSYCLEFRIMNSSLAGVSVVKIMDGDSTAYRGIKLSNMTNLYFLGSTIWNILIGLENSLVLKRQWDISPIHWGRGKLAAIFQVTLKIIISWMKMYKLRLTFHWSLFPRVQLTIFQHWFR